MQVQFPFWSSPALPLPPTGSDPRDTPQQTSQRPCRSLPPGESNLQRYLDKRPGPSQPVSKMQRTEGPALRLKSIPPPSPQRPGLPFVPQTYFTWHLFQGVFIFMQILQAKLPQFWPLGRYWMLSPPPGHSCLPWSFQTWTIMGCKDKRPSSSDVWFVFLSASEMCPFDHYSMGHFFKCKRCLLLPSKELSTFDLAVQRKCECLHSSQFRFSEQETFFENRNCSFLHYKWTRIIFLTKTSSIATVTEYPLICSFLPDRFWKSERGRGRDRGTHGREKGNMAESAIQKRGPLGSATWCVLSHFSHVRLAPLSIGFSRQEYWSGLPCPPPGDRPDPGIEPVSLTSPALAGGFFITRGRATWPS